MLDHIRKLHFSLIASCIVALYLSGGIRQVNDIKLSNDIDAVYELVHSGKLFLAVSNRNRKCGEYIENYYNDQDERSSSFPAKLEQSISTEIFSDIKKSIITGKQKGWPTDWPNYVKRENYITINDITKYSGKLRELLIRSILIGCNTIQSFASRDNKGIKSIKDFSERWDLLNQMANPIKTITGIKSIHVDRFWGTDKFPIRAEEAIAPDPRRILHEYSLNIFMCRYVSELKLIPQERNHSLPPGTSNYVTIICDPQGGEKEKVHLPARSSEPSRKSNDYHRTLNVELWVSRDEYNPIGLMESVLDKRRISIASTFKQTFPELAERSNQLPENIDDMKLVNDQYLKKPYPKISLFGMDIIAGKILFFTAVAVLTIQIYLYAYIKLIWKIAKEDDEFVWIVSGPNELLYFAIRWISIYLLPPFSILFTTIYQISIHPSLLVISSEMIINILMILLTFWSISITIFTRKVLNN